MKNYFIYIGYLKIGGGGGGGGIQVHPLNHLCIEPNNEGHCLHNLLGYLENSVERILIDQGPHCFFHTMNLIHVYGENQEE